LTKLKDKQFHVANCIVARMPTPAVTQVPQANDDDIVATGTKKPVTPGDVPVTQVPQTNDGDIVATGTIAQEDVPVTQVPQTNDGGIVVTDTMAQEDVLVTQVPQTNESSDTIHFL
jgi:hypothetical protein